MKRNKIFLWATVLSAVLIFAGCGTRVDSGRPQVYVSFSAMGALTAEIAGDRADIYTLVPPASEPHDYEPTARDIKNILNADVFVFAGNGMETADLTDTAASGNAVIVKASDGAPVKYDNSDPHIWLDPDNALYMMEKIKDALAEADTENSGYYEKRYKECVKKTAELNKTCNEFMGNGKKIIVQHGAYAYLLNRLNLTQVAIEDNGEFSDPPPSRIAEITDMMRDENIKYVFCERYGSNKIAEAVAEEVGAEVKPLNSLEGGDMRYFDIMEDNIARLALAVQ